MANKLELTWVGKDELLRIEPRLLIERNMTTAQLQHKSGFSSNIVPRMKRNGYISLDTIKSICRTLNCGVDDILEFVPNKVERGEHND